MFVMRLAVSCSLGLSAAIRIEAATNAGSLA